MIFQHLNIVMFDFFFFLISFSVVDTVGTIRTIGYRHEQIKTNAIVAEHAQSFACNFNSISLGWKHWNWKLFTATFSWPTQEAIILYSPNMMENAIWQLLVIISATNLFGYKIMNDNYTHTWFLRHLMEKIRHGTSHQNRQNIVNRLPLFAAAYKYQNLLIYWHKCIF